MDVELILRLFDKVENYKAVKAESDMTNRLDDPKAWRMAEMLLSDATSELTKAWHKAVKATIRRKE